MRGKNVRDEIKKVIVVVECVFDGKRSVDAASEFHFLPVAGEHGKCDNDEDLRKGS